MIAASSTMSSHPIKVLKRSQSESAMRNYEKYYRDNRSASESSEMNAINDSGSEFEDAKTDGFLAGLERKVNRLNDVVLDQCRLLTEIKDEIRESKTIIEQSEHVQNKFIADLLQQASSGRNSTGSREIEPVSANSSFNSRARSLLDAIELKQGFLDRELRIALVDCLQSEELKERMVSATVASVREMLGDNFSRDMSRLYVPILQRAHRRLTRQLTRAIEDAFAELESKSAQYSNSMCRASLTLRRALQRHQDLMETGEGRFSYMQYVVEETIQKEIQQWRHLVVEALRTEKSQTTAEAVWAERDATPPPLEHPDYPISPQQPASPGCSVIDQLMISAEINKQIQDGDINAAFERALSAADLSLVMAACRAVEPAQVFAPCRLRQSTLLSLAQQLPTDMVHDTQLKCRYLEEALINLDLKHPATSAHLPLVVGEIRKHLTKFLSTYPSHIACKRITLIIMAGDNLLK